MANKKRNINLRAPYFCWQNSAFCSNLLLIDLGTRKMKQNLKIIQFIFFGLLLSIFSLSTLFPAIKETAFPGIFMEKAEGFVTDFKLFLRGKNQVKSSIELVEIDNRTIEQFPEYGRWPWQRDPQAFLLYSILGYKPKLVVLDIIYAEAESVRIPPELEEDLHSIGRSDLVKKYSPEAKLLKVFNHYSDKIVMTAGSDSICSASEKECLAQVSNESRRSIEKWALGGYIGREEPPRIENPILNLTEYNEVAKNFGFSISQPGMDGVLRSMYLRFRLDGKVYPSLALTAAEFLKPPAPMPDINKIQLNFRTDIRSEHAISAADIFFAQKESAEGKALNQKLAARIKDKVIVLGVTASAAGDYHLTSAGILSGPEIVATAIDNLVANDFIRAPGLTLSALMIATFILLFGVAQRVKDRISSRFIFGFFGFITLLFFVVDFFFYLRNLNLPSVWFYLFFSGYGFLIVYEKYLVTESQKDFIKTAFSKYISPDFVNEIINNPNKLKIGGEKKELTIMFSDIRSFTTFSERMDAKTLGELLHEYLDEMTDIIFASRGTLDKYIGDAVMAFWGDPLEATDHAHSACESAKKMIVFLNGKQDYFFQKYGVNLQVGIGINTGIVSVGNMGSSKSLGYTVIGDSVNLTSRLEGATKNFGVSILTTESTLNQITASGHQLPSHRYLDSLKVKGKNKAVKVAQIFETDVPEEFVAEFASARELYLLQKWPEAIAAFENCNSLFKSLFAKEDPVSLIFIERCKDWQSEPPPKDWDGSWKLDSK